MTENEWWSRHIKPRWHNSIKRWVARKVQDVTNKGAPDVDACWNGYQCKVELKYAPKAPARSETLLTFSRYSKDQPNRRTIVSREQARNLEEWMIAGGNCFVLIGVEKAWFLMDVKLVLDHNDGLNMSQLGSWSHLTGQDIKSIDMVPDYLRGVKDE